MRNVQYFNPRRMARVAAFQSGAASDYNTLALQNNTNGALILKVWGFDAVGLGSSFFGAGTTQTFVNTTPITITPMVAGEALPPGRAANSQPAAQSTQDVLFSGTANQTIWWPYDYPVAVLQAGWSFFIQATSTNQSCAFSMIYEWVRSEEFNREEMEIANLALALNQQ